MDLLRQSGESLAGHIGYLELSPLDVRELNEREQIHLWSRGGFPRSFLAPDDAASALWRENFIHTWSGIFPHWARACRHRRCAGSGPCSPRMPKAASETPPAFARSLAMDGKTVARYVDLLAESPAHAPVAAVSRQRSETAGEVTEGLRARQRDRPHAVAARRRRGRARPSDRGRELGRFRRRGAAPGGAGTHAGPASTARRRASRSISCWSCWATGPGPSRSSVASRLPSAGDSASRSPTWLRSGAFLVHGGEDRYPQGRRGGGDRIESDGRSAGGLTGRSWRE